MYKACTKCETIKSLNEFYKNKRHITGVHCICKTCFKEYCRSFDGKIIRMYNDMKKGIKRNRVKSNKIINKQEFYKLAKDNSILILLHNNWINSNYNRKLTPSVDRIDNKRGYSKDNIQFITTFNNSIKGRIERDQNRYNNGNYKFPTAIYKWCNKCKKLVLKSLFHKDKSHKDGLRCHCKECRNKWCREQRKKTNIIK